MKKINLEYSYNTRDLGGYKTLDKKETKYDVFIRSDLIEKLNKEEVDCFLKKNIKTIIDFRTDEEIKRKPSYFMNDSSFIYNRVVLKGRDAPSKEMDIPYTYMDILNDKENMTKLINIILDSNGGILFHCNMGKDRTGVIAMILLLMANVSEDDIISDYSISDYYLKKVINEYHKNNPKAPKFIGSSKAIYMSKTLELFYKKYKSIYNYFKYLGFGNKEINIIKKRFLK